MSNDKFEKSTLIRMQNVRFIIPVEMITIWLVIEFCVFLNFNINAKIFNHVYNMYKTFKFQSFEHDFNL